MPLKDVYKKINQNLIYSKVCIIDLGLKKYFGIKIPKIIVSGLNPHAGEMGYLGKEEKDHIIPAIKELQSKGFFVKGPYPADSLFSKKNINTFDCFLTMYHDQGLPVFKYVNFGMGVNITLGLPVIRTSVDHGTALDLAKKGFGNADYSSMSDAILMACKMIKFSK